MAYESRKLTESERLYSIYDKEMFVVMHALAKFRQYLVGGKFVVKTDHNNLRHFLGQKDLNEGNINGLANCGHMISTLSMLRERKMQL
jgi:hypothetical protein